jgi:hypothetical protein
MLLPVMVSSRALRVSPVAYSVESFPWKPSKNQMRLPAACATGTVSSMPRFTVRTLALVWIATALR